MRNVRITRKCGIVILAALAVVPTLAGAQGLTVRKCVDTPGKEYTNLLDKNAAGAITFGQSLHWFGNGVVADSTRFGESEIDELANSGDALFFDVINNQAALLLSEQGDSGGNSVYSEDLVGSSAVWATKAMVNSTPGQLQDLDSLEVWGPDPEDDANIYSQFGDLGGVAVRDAGGLPLVMSADLAAAIGAPGLNVDLDGMMMGGNMLMFSIRPTGPFDGGEIWVYDWVAKTPASFLFHGGHLWDTAFDVRGVFHCLSENIDALEAVDMVPVPEPASMAALGIGIAAVIRRRRSRKV